MITATFAQNFADEWISAWNAHDLGRILAHYTDDFTMQSPVIVAMTGEPSGQLQGKGAVGAYWRTALAKIPDLHFELISVFMGTRSLAIHYRNAAGRLAVEVLEFNQSGLVCAAAAHYAA